MTRTEFLRQQTVSGANKCCRAPLPAFSTAEEPVSLAERKALALVKLFENMPVYIGEQELIVGTRTLFTPNEGNEDGHDRFQYGLETRIPYVNERDKELFGCDQSYSNVAHCTPDYGIILEKGIDGILREAEERQRDESLSAVSREFLSSVVLAYRGLKTMILRYEAQALALAKDAEGERRQELLEIGRICRKVSGAPAESFHEAVQLLWFAHLGVLIESFEFVNYGRVDVLLERYLGDTPREQAQQLIDCLLLKMYDQADLVTTYLGNYAAQLVVTLGGVLPNGENAVGDVTMLFLDAVDRVRLPEPEFNLRISSKNPPAFLDKAAALTVSGCNFISYYNDDLFVENLHRAGLPLEVARDYGFDLCQDINIPGRSVFYVLTKPSLAAILMDLLKDRHDFEGFEELVEAFKGRVAELLRKEVEQYRVAEAHLELYAKGDRAAYFEGIRREGRPVDRRRNSPMAPLPLLSGLFYGCIEEARDFVFEPYPVKERGVFFGTATEAVNALAAIKKTVYEEKRYTLEEVLRACETDFAGEKGRLLQGVLWNCPKWGNDDDYVDKIAKDVLEFCLRECTKYKTYYGGRVLGGIHQPHPIPEGARLMATPEGRRAGAPVAVTLTPESGTMKNGPTAVLCSAAKLESSLIHWNFCVMVNYYASVFKGNGGKDVFKSLLCGYFDQGGLQHQPNVLDVAELKKAQLEPENYKDLIVRLWGVSAHFVDLPRALQDEMIARFG